MQYQEFYAVHAETGRVLPYAHATVRVSSSSALAELYSASGAPIPNPAIASGTGLVGFAVIDGEYDVTITSGSYTAPPITKILFFDPVALVDEATGLVATTLAGAVKAEAAVVAAQALGNMWPDVNAGIEHTDDGGYFAVPGEGADSAVVYRRVGTSAEEVARLPSTQAAETVRQTIADLGLTVVTGVRSSDGREYPFALVDGNGVMAMGISSEGDVNLGSLNVDTGRTGFPFAITDSSGAAVVLVSKKGELWHAWQGSSASLEPPSLFDQLKASGMKELRVLPASRSIIIGLGQSNAIGTETEAETTVQPYQNLMFASGLTRRNYPGEGYDDSSLVPLIETTFVSGDDQRGETGLAALANLLTERAIAQGDTASNNVHVAFTAAVGGQSIRALMERPAGAFGDLWQYFGLPLEKIAALARSAGLSANVLAFKFDQGEQDITEGTPRQLYYDLVLEYFGQVVRAARKAFGQENIPLICVGQKFAHRRLSKDLNPIALAQRDLSLNVMSVMLTHPDYCLEGMAPSGLHFSAAAQRMAHSYAARAIDHVRRTGKKWRGVDVTSVLWQERAIEVGIHDPAGRGLVADVSYVLEAPNLGFDLWSASSGGYLPGAITSVTPRRAGLSIGTVADLPADVELVAGRGRPGDLPTIGRINGPRINIRDQYGDIDEHFASHNYMLAFSHFKSQGNFA